MAKSVSLAGGLHISYSVNNTYQEMFIERIVFITHKLTGSMAAKQKIVNNLVDLFLLDISSPVWHIKGKFSYLWFTCLLITAQD